MRRTLLHSSLIFIAGSSYGLLVPIIKNAAAIGIYPASFLPLQYLVVFLLCLVIVVVRRVKLPRPKTLGRLAVIGFFTGSCSICYYTAVSLLPSAVALTLLFQYVWVSVLLEWIIGHRKPSRSSLVAVVIVLVGTLFAAGVFDVGSAPLDPVGLLFGAGSALFYASFLFYSGRIGTDQPMLIRTTMLAVGGLVVTSLFSPLAYVQMVAAPQIWPYAILCSMMGILIPTTLINFASPKLSTGMVSVMASSELPIGILAGWAFAGDPPTPLMLLGTAIIFAGIIYKQLPAIRAVNESSADDEA